MIYTAKNTKSGWLNTLSSGKDLRYLIVSTDGHINSFQKMDIFTHFNRHAYLINQKMGTFTHSHRWAYLLISKDSHIYSFQKIGIFYSFQQKGIFTHLKR